MFFCFVRMLHMQQLRQQLKEEKHCSLFHPPQALSNSTLSQTQENAPMVVPSYSKFASTNIVMASSSKSASMDIPIFIDSCGWWGKQWTQWMVIFNQIIVKKSENFNKKSNIFISVPKLINQVELESKGSDLILQSFNRAPSLAICIYNTRRKGCTCHEKFEAKK